VWRTVRGELRPTTARLKHEADLRSAQSNVRDSGM
jgi:hypothetical protein